MDMKKSSVAILKSDKIDFKTRVIKTDRERHFIILKGRIVNDIQWSPDKASS